MTCAQAHMDRHLSQAIVQIAQMLSSAWWQLAPHRVETVLATFGNKYTVSDSRGRRRIYAEYGVSHPHNVWARQSEENYMWLSALGRALVSEYYHRFDKFHATSGVMSGLRFSPPEIPPGRMTKFYLEMPDYCKIHNDALASYRKFYNNMRKDLIHYTRRPPPRWLYTIATPR